MADNWKTDGKCQECRRKSYCSKACSKHKEMLKGLIQSKINEMFVSESEAIQCKK